MKGLSILIPTRNDECLELVKELLAQCEPLSDYEIIVADDGSTDNGILRINRNIAQLPHCRYIERKENTGRAAIRNFLAREAQFCSLLFIDCGRRVERKDFIQKYLGYSDVVYGGYCVPEQKGMAGNLRYMYERSAQADHTAMQRARHPYQHFNTCNVLVPRQVLMKFPFDEDVKEYGYEDVLYGKRLQQAGVRIRHIDNPLSLCRFESNYAYVRKIEESISTLVTFRDELTGYSRLLNAADLLGTMHSARLCRWMLSPLLPAMRKNLAGTRPRLCLLKLYKLGYMLNKLGK